jgi:hypothetical protein
MRNRHHRKKGPGRVHAQGLRLDDKRMFRSWEEGRLLDGIEAAQRYVTNHPRGVLGRIARWRLIGLQQRLEDQRKAVRA